MPGLRQLAFALVGTLGICTAPSSALAAKSARSVRHARAAALIAFQRDLVSLLAQRVDALPLLGAALLARPLPDQPTSNGFHHLIARAVDAPGHGPAQRWVQLADCDTRADACPNPDALAALVQEAPDNAAVWLLKLARDTHDGRRDDARADLAHAAQARRYDDYTGISLQALATGVGVLPPPEATLDPQAGAGAAGVRAMIVFGIGGAQPQPGLQATAQLCRAAGQDPELAADCRQLGKTLEWGSSPLARSLGLYLREVLAGDAAARVQARQERRDLVWQLQQFTRLAARAQNDEGQARHLLSLAGRGDTEMRLMLAALRDAGRPTTAPVGWEPNEEENRDSPP